MHMLITGKKIEVGETLRAQVENKINDLCQKYSLSPIETTVTFSKDGPTFHKFIRCAVEMHLGCNVFVRAHEETDDAGLSFEQAIETFEKRVRRYKKRLVAHQQKRDVPYTKVPALQYTINLQSEGEIEEENPLVIAEVKTEIPTLTVSEAVMRLDLSDAQVMLFNNVAHDELNVVYWRPDGNIGWIAPSK